MDRQQLIQQLADMREQSPLEMRTDVGSHLQTAFNQGFRDLPGGDREVADVIHDIVDLTASFVSLSLLVQHDSCVCDGCQAAAAANFSNAIIEYGHALVSAAARPAVKAVH